MALGFEAFQRLTAGVGRTKLHGERPTLVVFSRRVRLTPADRIIIALAEGGVPEVASVFGSQFPIQHAFVCHPSFASHGGVRRL